MKILRGYGGRLLLLTASATMIGYGWLGFKKIVALLPVASAPDVC